VLLFPNLVEDSFYFEQLQDRISRRGVDARFVSDRVAFKRAQRDGEKVYSFWDTYLFADVMTYPSLQEGWGNQFLEGVWAKLPVVLFEYPVFRTDIAPLGFKYVSLGDKVEQDSDGLRRVPTPVLKRAAKEAAGLLSSPRQYKQVVEHNYMLARRSLSLERLQELLGTVVARALEEGL